MSSRPHTTSAPLSAATVGSSSHRRDTVAAERARLLRSSSCAAPSAAAIRTAVNVAVEQFVADRDDEALLAAAARRADDDSADDLYGMGGDADGISADAAHTDDPHRGEGPSSVSASRLKAAYGPLFATRPIERRGVTINHLTLLMPGGLMPLERGGGGAAGGGGGSHQDGHRSGHGGGIRRRHQSLLEANAVVWGQNNGTALDRNTTVTMMPQPSDSDEEEEYDDEVEGGVNAGDEVASDTSSLDSSDWTATDSSDDNGDDTQHSELFSQSQSQTQSLSQGRSGQQSPMGFSASSPLYPNANANARGYAAATAAASSHPRAAGRPPLAAASPTSSRAGGGGPYGSAMATPVTGNSAHGNGPLFPATTPLSGGGGVGVGHGKSAEAHSAHWGGGGATSRHRCGIPVRAIVTDSDIFIVMQNYAPPAKGTARAAGAKGIYGGRGFSVGVGGRPHLQHHIFSGRGANAYSANGGKRLPWGRRRRNGGDGNSNNNSAAPRGLHLTGEGKGRHNGALSLLTPQQRRRAAIAEARRQRWAAEPVAPCLCVPRASLMNVTTFDTPMGAFEPFGLAATAPARQQQDHQQRQQQYAARLQLQRCLQQQQQQQQQQYDSERCGGINANANFSANANNNNNAFEGPAAATMSFFGGGLFGGGSSAPSKQAPQPSSAFFSSSAATSHTLANFTNIAAPPPPPAPNAKGLVLWTRGGDKIFLAFPATTADTAAATTMGDVAGGSAGPTAAAATSAPNGIGSTTASTEEMDVFLLRVGFSHLTESATLYKTKVEAQQQRLREEAERTRQRQQRTAAAAAAAAAAAEPAKKNGGAAIALQAPVVSGATTNVANSNANVSISASYGADEGGRAVPAEKEICLEVEGEREVHPDADTSVAMLITHSAEGGDDGNADNDADVGGCFGSSEIAPNRRGRCGPRTSVDEFDTIADASDPAVVAARREAEGGGGGGDLGGGGVSGPLDSPQRIASAVASRLAGGAVSGLVHSLPASADAIVASLQTAAHGAVTAIASAAAAQQQQQQEERGMGGSGPTEETLIFCDDDGLVTVVPDTYHDTNTCRYSLSGDRGGDSSCDGAEAAGCSSPHARSNAAHAKGIRASDYCGRSLASAPGTPRNRCRSEHASSSASAGPNANGQPLPQPLLAASSPATSAAAAVCRPLLLAPSATRGGAAALPGGNRTLGLPLPATSSATPSPMLSSGGSVSNPNPNTIAVPTSDDEAQQQQRRQEGGEKQAHQQRRMPAEKANTKKKATEKAKKIASVSAVRHEVRAGGTVRDVLLASCRRDGPQLALALLGGRVVPTAAASSGAVSSADADFVAFELRRTAFFRHVCRELGVLADTLRRCEAEGREKKDMYDDRRRRRDQRKKSGGEEGGLNRDKSSPNGKKKNKAATRAVGAALARTWFAHDMRAEMARQQLSGFWGFSTLNKRFEKCSTYPRLVVAPRDCCEDDDRFDPLAVLFDNNGGGGGGGGRSLLLGSEGNAAGANRRDRSRRGESVGVVESVGDDDDFSSSDGDGYGTSTGFESTSSSNGFYCSSDAEDATCSRSDDSEENRDDRSHSPSTASASAAAAENRRDGDHTSPQPASSPTAAKRKRNSKRRGRRSNNNDDEDEEEGIDDEEAPVVVGKAGVAAFSEAWGHRTRDRVQALTYYHAFSGGAILRSSQPTLWAAGRAKEMAKRILATTPARPLDVFDLRPFANAAANAVHGGYFEPSCPNLVDVHFCSIGNIHVVSKGYDRLMALCQSGAPRMQWHRDAQTLHTAAAIAAAGQRRTAAAAEYGSSNALRVLLRGYYSHLLTSSSATALLLGAAETEAAQREARRRQHSLIYRQQQQQQQQYHHATAAEERVGSGLSASPASASPSSMGPAAFLFPSQPIAQVNAYAANGKGTALGASSSVSVPSLPQPPPSPSAAAGNGFVGGKAGGGVLPRSASRGAMPAVGTPTAAPTNAVPFNPFTPPNNHAAASLPLVTPQSSPQQQHQYSDGGPTVMRRGGGFGGHSLAAPSMPAERLPSTMSLDALETAGPQPKSLFQGVLSRALGGGGGGNNTTSAPPAAITAPFSSSTSPSASPSLNASAAAAPMAAVTNRRFNSLDANNTNNTMSSGEEWERDPSLVSAVGGGLSHHQGASAAHASPSAAATSALTSIGKGLGKGLAAVFSGVVGAAGGSLDGSGGAMGGGGGINGSGTGGGGIGGSDGGGVAAALLHGLSDHSHPFDVPSEREKTGLTTPSDAAASVAGTEWLNQIHRILSTSARVAQTVAGGALFLHSPFLSAPVLSAILAEHDRRLAAARQCRHEATKARRRRRRQRLADVGRGEGMEDGGGGREEEGRWPADRPAMEGCEASAVSSPTLGNRRPLCTPSPPPSAPMLQEKTIEHLTRAEAAIDRSSDAENAEEEKKKAGEEEEDEDVGALRQGSDDVKEAECDAVSQWTQQQQHQHNNNHHRSAPVPTTTNASPPSRAPSAAMPTPKSTKKRSAPSPLPPPNHDAMVPSIFCGFPPHLLAAAGSGSAPRLASGPTPLSSPTTATNAVYAYGPPAVPSPSSAASSQQHQQQHRMLPQNITRRTPPALLSHYLLTSDLRGITDGRIRLYCTVNSDARLLPTVSQLPPMGGGGIDGGPNSSTSGVNVGFGLTTDATSSAFPFASAATSAVAATAIPSATASGVGVSGGNGGSSNRPTVEREHYGRHVVVHCSDGWDRTSQVCALSQIMLDPHFRTIRGFCGLIEKDFVSFGHQFRLRSDFTTRSRGGAEPHSQTSPVFVQFLDCVHQLMAIYPRSFEFTESFLLLVVDLMHSGATGTFAANCLFEIYQWRLREQSLSLWQIVSVILTASPFTSSASSRPNAKGEEYQQSQQSLNTATPGISLDAAAYSGLLNPSFVNVSCLPPMPPCEQCADAKIRRAERRAARLLRRKGGGRSGSSSSVAYPSYSLSAAEDDEDSEEEEEEEEGSSSALLMRDVAYCPRHQSDLFQHALLAQPPYTLAAPIAPPAIRLWEGYFFRHADSWHGRGLRAQLFRMRDGDRPATDAAAASVRGGVGGRQQQHQQQGEDSACGFYSTRGYPWNTLYAPSSGNDALGEGNSPSSVAATRNSNGLSAATPVSKATVSSNQNGNKQGAVHVRRSNQSSSCPQPNATAAAAVVYTPSWATPATPQTPVSSVGQRMPLPPPLNGAAPTSLLSTSASAPPPPPRQPSFPPRLPIAGLSEAAARARLDDDDDDFDFGDYDDGDDESFDDTYNVSAAPVPSALGGGGGGGAYHSDPTRGHGGASRAPTSFGAQQEDDDDW